MATEIPESLLKQSGFFEREGERGRLVFFSGAKKQKVVKFEMMAS